MTSWLDPINEKVLLAYNTRLVGGFPEPFYKAAVNNSPAEVQFTRDFERSALHELAHWCIAGAKRRLVDDYGYWYEPDGRSEEQQQSFFRVEVKPQAIEKHFCLALDIPFQVSLDNIDNTPSDGIDGFIADVEQQYQAYLGSGFPDRAREIYNFFRQAREPARKISIS
jgi:elongation factor P hydroxylase